MGKVSQVCIAVFAFMLLQACNIQAETNAQKKVQGEILSGHYIVGHEVNSFQPCGQQTVYWVTGPEKMMKLLEQKYRQLSSRPYSEVYVEMRGGYLAKATDGFAMDYEGQIIVNELIRMETKSKNRCQ